MSGAGGDRIGAETVGRRPGPLPGAPRLGVGAWRGLPAWTLAVLLVPVLLGPRVGAAVDPAAPPDPLATTSVGEAAEVLELVLPGSRLEPRESDAATALVVRVASASPHGSDWRYDLAWYGLEPGGYDLRDFLQREDGSPVDDLRPLPVEVVSVLPAGQVLPSRLEAGEPPSVGGYGTWLVVGGLLWVAGLVAILRAGRARRLAAAPVLQRPVTIAERLRPLVQAALDGRLERAEQARLELSLIAYWRRRLGLDGDAASALATLRAHAEAGPLLTALEEWLHRPERPEGVDLSALLAPYRDLPVDELPEPLPGSSA